MEPNWVQMLHCDTGYGTAPIYLIALWDTTQHARYVEYIYVHGITKQQSHLRDMPYIPSASTRGTIVFLREICAPADLTHTQHSLGVLGRYPSTYTEIGPPWHPDRPVHRERDTGALSEASSKTSSIDFQDL